MYANYELYRQGATSSGAPTTGAKVEKGALRNASHVLKFVL